MKKLSDLYPGSAEVEVKDIKINSKEITPGDIFVCTMGFTADRHNFIDEAIKNGASALIVSKPGDYKIPYVLVEDTNKELPLLAAKLYDYPDQDLKIIAITGTNGKTSVAEMIQTLIGKDLCAYMGTNGISCGSFKESIRNTTPDSDRLYKYFKRFVDSGCKYLSIETSSEAFYHNRLDKLAFEVGIVTNITEDHLNIHKTLENYVASKQRLLKQVKKEGFCILNTEDEYYESSLSKVTSNLFTYGKKESTLQILDYELKEDKTIIKLKYNNQIYTVNSPLLGEFNIYNLCAAILAMIALGFDIEDIIKRVLTIKPSPGRVEFLDYGQNYKIMLDYAHTTDAFTNLYPLLQRIKKNRIITITGSAGGRETEKRGPMGKVVLDNSDLVIFTMDDPRHESVDSITDDLISLSDKTNYERINDRKEAIYRAFDIALENDIVLVAGKGVDNYMALGDEYLPYNDLEVIETYFREKEEQ